MKVCTKCDQLKPESSVYYAPLYRKGKQYFSGMCRECKNSKRRVKPSVAPKYNSGSLRQCIKCDLVRPIDNFANKRKEKSSICMPCMRIYSRNYYANNSEDLKSNARRHKASHPNQYKNFAFHNISQDNYNLLLQKHDGLCWICKDKQAICIDHDHSCCDSKSRSCGKCIRGVLCNGCNFMIGLARDDVQVLKSAIEYLKLPDDISSLL